MTVAYHDLMDTHTFVLSAPVVSSSSSPLLFSVHRCQRSVLRVRVLYIVVLRAVTLFCSLHSGSFLFFLASFSLRALHTIPPASSLTVINQFHIYVSPTSHRARTVLFVGLDL
ncbi:hypothetical protein BD309DRAFT_289555 [Dichomitus squalens]|nr:hypothetical protein BD309DRAFT_289555 [Dichomitus squalens]